MYHFEHIRVQANDDVVIVHLKDKRLIDTRSITELQTELLTTIFDLNPTRLIVNFAAVERILTEVVNVLLFAREQIGQRDGELSLCDLQQPILEVFKLLHLDFEICDNVCDGSVSMPEATRRH